MNDSNRKNTPNNPTSPKNRGHETNRDTTTAKNNPNTPQSQNGSQRIELPSGGYGVYMGETGKEHTTPRRRRPQNPQKRIHQGSGTPNGYAADQYGPARPADPRRSDTRSQVNRQDPAARNDSQRPRYALSDAERQEIERRHAIARAKRRAAADNRLSKYRKDQKKEPTLKEGLANYINYYFKLIVDRIYMTWMGITIDLDTVIKSLIIAGMILIFAILQTTIFSRFAPFGATPDLMLALVIAVGTTEGERWGGATGLAAAFLIEALGGTGITLLPLLYVPIGYTVGVLCTEYLRDSVIIRLIFTFGAGILRAVMTAVYALIAFDKIDGGLLFTTVLIPEYFSTALMAFLPHVTEWFALKAFHKSREDRIS